MKRKPRITIQLLDDISYSPPDVQAAWMSLVLGRHLRTKSRRGNRDKKIWNIACDYVTNTMLKAQGLKLPKGSLYKSKYKDMSVEQIYEAEKAKTKQGKSR